MNGILAVEYLAAAQGIDFRAPLKTSPLLQSFHQELRALVDNYSEDRMRLLGYSLEQKLVVIPEHRTAYISLTRNELNRFNHAKGDTEGFVNYPFSVSNIRVSALFIERKDHIKISFRSKGDFPINTLAAQFFNGGGHKNAAGGESYEDLAVTIKKFENLIGQYSDEINRIP